MPAAPMKADISLMAKNLSELRQEIAELAHQHGHPCPQIVVVSKYYDAADCNQLLQAGLTPLGENRIQEFTKKYDQCLSADRDIGVEASPSSNSPEKRTQSSSESWHFIGHMQRNKIAQVIGKASLFHSLDSERLARAFQKEAAKRLEDQLQAGAAPANECSPPLRLLAQVNVSGEASKGGLSPEEAAHSIPQWIAKFPQLEICGLMTMAPIGDHDSSRPYFAQLRQIRDQIRHQLDEPHKSSFKELSMGMSSDYRAAVAEGASWLRLGRILNR